MLNKDRLSRVVRNMQKENLPQILVSSTQAVYYLTGLWIIPGERLVALHITDTGEVRMIANRLFALSGACGDLPLAEHDDTDDAVAALAAYLKPGVLGVDKFWPSHFAIRLMALRPDIRLAVGSAPVDEARMFKDAAEMEFMRASSRVNDKLVAALPPTFTLGERESDVARRYVNWAGEYGAQGGTFTLVCFGANGAQPHHNTDDTRLKEGDAIIVDVGVEIDHFMSDITRTFFFGSATDEQKRVYDVVKAANAAARAAVRPGIPMCEIDRAARKVIEQAGYGPYFIHRTGHGIGIEGHEAPDCSATCQMITRPGLVFSIEPGIYLPGKFGVRIEDLVAVTEDGCETLNQLDRELQIIT